MKKKNGVVIFPILIIMIFSCLGLNENEDIRNYFYDLFNINNVIYTIEDIPDYNGKPYVYINNNIPYFTEEEYTTKVFEKYSNLDYLKRAGTAYILVLEKS